MKFKTWSARMPLFILACLVLNLSAKSVGATVLYNSVTGLLGQAPLLVDYASQITLAGPDRPYSLTSFGSFGMRWDDLSQGQQIVQFKIYSGASLSPTATNIFANATLDGSGAFYVSDPGSYEYTFTNLTFQSPIAVPSNTFTVQWSLYNGSFSGYSNAVNSLIYAGPTLATGSDTGFIWEDFNQSGTFLGSEQSTTAGGGSAAHVPFIVNGTVVPEPRCALLLLSIIPLIAGRHFCRARTR